jgi:GT2 family glycosyltransferase
MSTKYPAMEVVVVDNNSGDGSAEFVSENFPTVRLVRNKENFGSAGGYNIGISESRGKYVSLLSNDMEVDANWLLPLVSIMEKREDVAAVDAWFLNYYDRDRFDTVVASGRYVDYFGNVLAHGSGDTHRNVKKSIRRVFMGMALVRKKTLDEVGLIQPDFFFGYEDVDLFWRINLKGLKALSVPSSKIYHKSGGTSRQGEMRKPHFYYLEKRNRLISVIKNSPLRSLIFTLPVILLEYMSYLAFWTLRRNKLNTVQLARCLSWFLKRKNLRNLRVMRKMNNSINGSSAAPLRDFLVPYCGDLLNLAGKRRAIWTDGSGEESKH